MVRALSTQGEMALVVAFESTASALAFAEGARREGLAGRLIPVPRRLSAGCGMAWREPTQGRSAVEALLCQLGIDDASVVEMPLR